MRQVVFPTESFATKTTTIPQTRIVVVVVVVFFFFFLIVICHVQAESPALDVVWNEWKADQSGIGIGKESLR